MDTFATAGYLRGAIGPDVRQMKVRGRYAGPRRALCVAGGIGLQPCVVTDDGVRCALEYNCVRWGSHDLPPQAGIVVFERGPDGLLAVVRIYDDVEAPVAEA